MEMNKARNLIEHEEEIFSRPPRVWFQSKADLKRKSGKRSIKFEVLIVLTCKINIVAVMNMFLFLSTDKAASGPANKKSKNENKKGKTTASGNENVIKAVVVFLVLNDYEMRQSSVGKKMATGTFAHSS